MKIMKKSILALCLLGTGVVYGQTTSGSTYNSGSTSTTTTNSNMSSPTYNSGSMSTTGTGTSGTYNSTGSMNNTGMSGTMSNTGTSGSMNNTTNSNYPAGNTGTITPTGNMNNTGATNTYDSRTTTTSSSSDYNTNDRANRNNRDADGTRKWGKSGKFGVYAGLNFSRFVNEPIQDNAYRTGWQAGLYGRSGGTVFGQIGLEYRNSTANLVRAGSSVIGNPVSTTAAPAADISGQVNQHFLAIPAYVGLRVGSALGLRVQAGAELSSQVAIGDNNFQLGRDDVRRTILNGLLGAGINLGPVTLDAVYNLGLSNVFEGLDTKRRMVQVNVGLRF